MTCGGVRGVGSLAFTATSAAPNTRRLESIVVQVYDGRERAGGTQHCREVIAPCVFITDSGRGQSTRTYASVEGLSS
jgi:hypothetical protein